MKSTDPSSQRPDTFGTPEENPFCQIYGRDISESQCIDVQGATECFGCAAITRLCEHCNIRHVDVPAVGMCGQCIVTELKVSTSGLTEKNLFPSLPNDTSIQCQIVKRKIGVTMCTATQGDEGCQGCSAPSRVCEKCKKFPVRFPRYGLCLGCSVEEYGDGWDPGTVVVKSENLKKTELIPSPEGARIRFSFAIPRTDPDASKDGRIKKANAPSIPENERRSILVVGGDTSNFKVDMLRDKRVRYWDINDIKKDGTIPSATEKLIYSSGTVTKGKVSTLKRLIIEARERGQTLAVWDVPNQGRLQEVLQTELAPTIEEVIMEKPTVISTEDSIMTPLTEETEVEFPVSEVVQQETVLEETPTKGNVEVGEYKTQKQIIEENLEATEGNAEKLLKILRKTHPNANIHTIHTVKSILKREKATREEEGARPASEVPVQKTLKGLRSSKSSLVDRMLAAIGKIQEGLTELNTLSGEIGGMNARLQLLAPFEAAMKQISSTQTSGKSTPASE